MPRVVETFWAFFFCWRSRIVLVLLRARAWLSDVQGRRRPPSACLRGLAAGAVRRARASKRRVHEVSFPGRLFATGVEASDRLAATTTGVDHAAFFPETETETETHLPAAAAAAAAVLLWCWCEG